MSEVNEVKAQKYMESESKRYENEIKKLRADNGRNYTSEVKTNESEMSRMREDYDTKIANLNT
jgi:hypothetical protein